MKYLAHINKQGEEQTLKEHNMRAAEIAGDSLKTAGLYHTAYLAGLMHDMGKFTEKFQDYLHAAANGEKVIRGSVNHTFAGVRYLLEKFHISTVRYEDIAAEIIAYAVGSHHGLFDCIDENYKSGFQHRIDKDDTGYDEAVSNFISECADSEKINALFSKTVPETEQVIKSICDMTEDADEIMFYISLVLRLVLSAVMEGDRKDTAEFMLKADYPSYTKEDLKLIWAKSLSDVEEKILKKPADSDIDKARGKISSQCRDFAEKKGGIYRLNVPTGAGKTLSSLRYALAHAKKWDKSHIIFTSPLLSILDQNAKVIHNHIQNDSIILEHHSNVVKDDSKNSSSEKLSENELLTDNWSVPVIITTMVQLLNTIFDGRTTCIRRFHALCNSVIVIDEVQTVPSKMLTLFNLAMNFLSKICNATIILCSATQPCLESTAHSINGNIEEMVPYEKSLWKPFKRTVIQNAGFYKMDEIPSFIMDVADETDSLLVICNKKSEAAELYNALSGTYDANIYHLSASMCMAHRREELSKINESLTGTQNGMKKTICISTQVIEAGVDISFGRVIRLMAGIDSIVQAAGRCNRNGENKSPAPVYIVNCKDENMKGLPDIEIAQGASLSLLSDFENSPDKFDNSLVSDKSVSYYYRVLYKRLYEKNNEYMDYPLGKSGESIYSLLSMNEKYTDTALCSDAEKFFLRQSVKKAGQLFHVLDSDTYDILVPYEMGKEIINDLQTEKSKNEISYRMQLLEKSKSYTVSVYAGNLKALESAGAVYSVCEGSVIVLKDEFYNKFLGYVKKADIEKAFLES
jgi:CRISPR-associated endonuclease/helicase Cas3